MKKNILLLFFIVFSQYSFSQDKYSYLPFPNDKQISEIKFIYENGNFWQKKKYFYSSENKIDKIEKLNSFDILISTKKYEYDNQNRIIQINELNTFNFPIKKNIYKYFEDKYVVTLYDKYEKIIGTETYDLQNRINEHLTYKVTEKSYRYVWKYIYENPLDYDYYRYAPDNTLEETQTLRHNKINETETQTLDEKGNIVAIEKSLFNTDKQVISVTSYSFENKIIGQTIFKYNQYKKLISRVSTGENNEYEDKITFEYDKKNRLIRETNYGREILKAKPKFQSESVFIYDENNNLIETHNFNNYTGKKMLGSKEFYDKERRLTRKNEYYLGKISKVTIYENGLEILETRYNDDGTIFDIAKNEYDNKGNLITVTVTNSDNSLKEKFGYKYDETGMKTMVEY
ncbi:hypothetical protein IA01_10685 [Flavobacterium psychrophilum]|uniref:Uncharacterized protein n=16 Tax=Flavobacterium psychrophilum TaxID=96345 RepID=A6H1J9_FLAPJ|nr:hypothetical protein [Flavobacterium psychrophilum]AIG30900.1 hypothetical protein IA03_10670 [Flavobacterium psychrophilum]AIG33173.1 hypothetical protein IA01_10685 [Flavobacterium psychrophilum]AIG35326.1 hypothetical protein IA02_10050 [Flavobacterium psychrophilum]AIG37687.1 hypothetical protein IA04_10555 [Flavobacterium psychrophilum]AIG39959.1 hypothetical protein IA05_10660 [Flavobacterium psychrophilum]